MRDPAATLQPRTTPTPPQRRRSARYGAGLGAAVGGIRVGAAGLVAMPDGTAVGAVRVGATGDGTAVGAVVMGAVAVAFADLPVDVPADGSDVDRAVVSAVGDGCAVTAGRDGLGDGAGE